MSATASPSLPRSTSTRRNQAYGSPNDRPHGSPSPKTSAPDASSRSAASPQVPSKSSHSRSGSAAQGGNTPLTNVIVRDHEQLNLARSEGQRNDSRDRPAKEATVGVTRSESSRNGHSSRHTHSRQQSEATSANGGGHESSSRQTATDAAQGPRRRTTVDAKTGTWELGKTIGAGSMGKVKLARHKDTHEQVAVKIIPRQSTDEHKTAAEKERADHSKEVRTAREAAIVTLVDHPYICGMRDYVKTRYHWYMLFEFVNGGQMLDYIISHGRLKEKQARRFGRQIASALDYCHRNNIVHRDLKIENILISKTGDIKIIDFGLSNTFTPHGHLKTFCGSLYFAAPELLQAKQYTGPEVDVWSFGIVLYVLVCGKVPFDDQSMPQLHAKIKKGHVDYPPWLTNECRSLIARMLQTDPNQRATMNEILNHPWITKGFSLPPDNHLPPRKPLALPLDRNAIRKMDGFDFGSANAIEEQLTRIVESEEYQKAIQNWEKKATMPSPELEKKRGVFDFYKRRNSLSRDTLNSSSSEAVQWGADPINGFHPLVSVYYLAKEKVDRDFRAANPGVPYESDQPKSEKPTPQSTPSLAAPEAAYTNPATYEMAGEAPTGGRSRPRARTHGQEEVTQDLRRVKIDDSAIPQTTPQVVAPADQAPAKKERTAANLLRRLSTRRHRDRDRDRDQEKNTEPPAVAINPLQESTYERHTIKKSFSIRRRDHSSSRTPSVAPSPTPPQPDLLAAPEDAHGGGLGRSTSVNSGDFRRRLAKRQSSDAAQLWSTPQGKRQGSIGHPSGVNDGAVSEVEAPQSAPPASRTKSLGHARRESIQRRRQERARNRIDAQNSPREADTASGEDDAGFSANEGGSPGSMKPVFLKGLFSVSTTSSKPFKVIEADIVRVLRQLDIQFSSNGKGGFKCKHSASVNSDAMRAMSEAPQISTPAGLMHRRKLSFNFMGGDRDDKDRQPRTPPTSSRGKGRSLDHSDDDPIESEVEEGMTPSLDRRLAFPAGETSTHVQNDLGNNTDLRFEIFVVKVPLLSLHGIQFKKVDGGTWQYKNMAQTILDELNL
ncbi:Pkinase-domain-containing protein [Myriangium duriaei CBS 260.36]|uniref:non-specific serine/threonine protein kinase n=1 Tax=Myriangium duriaei CBS 260.36 TaxID=1168546 RepID=A0A9P4J9W3_9PEZI|nr:Pkinase-domain-containing protein [Myriangium duriaei CBS 260.36]